MKTPIPMLLAAAGTLLDGIHETSVLSVEFTNIGELHIHLSSLNDRDALDLLTLTATRLDAVTKVISEDIDHYGYWKVEVQGLVNGVNARLLVLLDREPTEAQLAPLQALARTAVAA